MFKKIKKNMSSDSSNLRKEISSTESSIENFLGKQELQSNKIISVIQNNLNLQNTSIDEIKNQLQAIQSLTLDKDKKLRRYEDGYDLKIYKSFLSDILRIYDDIKEKSSHIQKDVDLFLSQINLQDNNNSKKFANNTKDLLEESLEDIENMLENNNIYKYDIECGKIYNNDGKTIVEIKEAIETDDCYEKGSVVEILKDGFYTKLSQEEEKQIRMAEIKTKK